MKANGSESLSEPPKTRSALVLGKGELAIRAARWFADSANFELVGVIPQKPEPAWAPSLGEWADRNRVECVDSGRFQDFRGGEEGDWSVDVGCVFAYMSILPEWFISRFGRILNLHQSALPKYRGVGSINWALKNGEAAHGATLHELTAEVDAGPVLAQVTYSIYPGFDEVEDVYARGIEYSWTLFEQTMPLLDRIEGVSQDESEATYFSEADRDRLGERRTFTKARSAVG
jgi:methionyl-tRNA formyltransferase